MTHKVFVYGTLKDKSRQDNFYVKGKLFDIGPFPGIKLQDNNSIPGQVFEVTDDELKNLDRYEGVPTLYVRERTLAYPIGCDNGSFEEVWIYEFNGSVDNLLEINSW